MDYAKEISELQQRVSNLEKVVRVQQEIITNNELSIKEDKNLVPVKTQELIEPVRRIPLQEPESKVPIYSPKEETRNKKFAVEESLEAQIGGTWLNRIGIVAFVIGMGLFLQYSFENNLIGPVPRIILGIITGLVFLGIGEWAQRKNYHIFAQGATGGGIATLYFSIFAAFNFYNLIAQVPAFGIMSVITAMAVYLSVRYDSLAIAILGIIGGFLTPLMLNTGEPNTIGLFTYIGILNLGIIAIAFFKSWRALNLLSFGFTQFIILVWTAEGHHSDSEGQIIYTIFFLLFAILALFNNIINKRVTKSGDLIILGLNASIYLLLSLFNLDEEKHWYLTIAVTVFYGALAYITYKIPLKDRYLSMSYIGSALVFLTITFPLYFHSDNGLMVAWSVEAIFLLWMSFRLDNYRLRQVSTIIYILNCYLLLNYSDFSLYYDTVDQHINFVPIYNFDVLTFLIGLSSIWGGAYLHKKYTSESTVNELLNFKVFLLVGSIGLLYMFSKESYFYFTSLKILNQSNEAVLTKLNNTESLTLSVIWALYSIGILTIGMIKRIRELRIFAIILFGITIFKVFFIDLSGLTTFYRIISFIGLGTILIGVSFTYQKYRDKILGIVKAD